jgi:hypothetical protein
MHHGMKTIELEYSTADYASSLGHARSLISDDDELGPRGLLSRCCLTTSCQMEAREQARVGTLRVID